MLKILAIDDNNDNLVVALKALLDEAFPDAIVILLFIAKKINYNKLQVS